MSDSGTPVTGHAPGHRTGRRPARARTEGSAADGGAVPTDIDTSTTEVLRAPARRRGGKGERLVVAAARLFHEQGVGATSIADVAAAAEVPVGNVYYYFKAKDDLVAAVITAHLAAARAGFAALEAAEADPAARLSRWFHELAATKDSISRYGCPLGTLSSELAKRARGADARAAQLLGVPIDWASAQFALMGRADAPDLGRQLVAAYSGAAVVAHSSGTPDLMDREAERVDAWLDALTSTGSGDGTG